jgi:hypothetical protein
MKTKIDHTAFGSITIDGQRYEYDIVIGLNDQVRKRRKKLSKKIYGTSHTISIDEAKDIYEKSAELLIIGTGQYSQIKLSDEAKNYFKKKECRVQLLATPEACKAWNKSENKKTIGLFHITC